MSTSRRELIKKDCEQVAAGSINGLNQLKGSKVLITGGTGFMGTWLSEMMAYLNDVHSFDIKMVLLSGRANSFSAKAHHLAMRSDVTLIERDVRNLLDVPEDVNWIIHAAGNPDSRLHASDPLRTIDVIVNGTRSILECATRLPDVKKILNISSGMVYGSQPKDLENIPENHFGNLDSWSFRSTYPEAKRMAELLCAVYRNQHRLPIVNVRPFAFIGPYQLLDRPWAINNFIRDSLHGGPIRILGDGETVRSYMYPSDMAWWLLNMLTRGDSGACYNLGSPDGVSLLRLADMIAHQFPNPPKIVSRVSEDKSLVHTKFVPDVDSVQKGLGLSLKVDLETAIKRTLSWNQIT